MLASLLRRVVRTGSLVLIDPHGRRAMIGSGSTPVGTLRVMSRLAEMKVIMQPTLGLGEGYMDGSIVVSDGTIYDVLALLARNADNIPAGSIASRGVRLRSWLKQRNPAARSRRNVAHHYDLSPALYELFLDVDRQYSCAYFENVDAGLDEAQAAKKRLVASKLLLDRPDLRVLDIGSGWGGLGLHLAESAGARVTGVTLSVEQQVASAQRSAAAGLQDKVRFELRDYRHQAGRFDRVVSVGMFEHVGKRNYVEFFRKLNDLLADDGVALVHTCGFTDRPAPIDPFIRKYIFPGADVPSLSEISAVIERSGLMITDVEVLRLHYAETLRHWRARFCARWDEAARLYDQEFCRMWEYYLALCEVGFRYRTSVVFQLQITRRLDTLPTTRDYMAEVRRRAEVAAVDVAR